MTESTSRIIVKGLPKWITEQRLKSHFEVAGQVTDIRLMHTRAGVFRRFAFVGFSDEHAAKAAISKFNGTFVDTARIEVQPAYPRESTELARPWSKYSTGSSLHTAYLESKGAANAADKSKVRDKGAISKNGKAEVSLNAKNERKRKMLASICGSDSEEQSIETAKKPHLSRKQPSKTKDAIFDQSDVSSESSEEYQDISDQRDLNAGDSSENEPSDSVSDEKHTEAPEDARIAEKIMDTGRLFVRNLTYGCTEDDLRQLFGRFGELVDVHVSVSKETKRCKGFAHVLFLMPEHALKAYGSLDGTAFQGRLLHILPAEEAPESKSKASTSYKSQKEATDKAEAQRGHNWNTLFIRSDTVMDAVAARLGVDKADLLDAERNADGLLASRVAVAEAALVQETKAALESEGIVLEAFDGRPTARSNTVILVKNLPYSGDHNALRALFEKFGQIARFVLPPTKAVAVVEFFESADARKAFSSLAYTRFKDVPLYLEWAPVGSVKPQVAKLQPATADSDERPVEDSEHALVESGQKTTDAEQSSAKLAAGTYTLYVKNVSFATIDDDLLKVFSEAGRVLSARIARKRGGLSMGFAFVEYADSDGLSRAIDTLQGRVVDGHSLQILKSQAGQKHNSVDAVRVEAVPEPDDGKCTKLIVRNIPFEANEKEVRALFKAFAQVRRVRLPQRFDGRHRGFGFVDFATHTEAAHAKSVLSSTHLYGRHLVIEWANTEEAAEAEHVSRQQSATNALHTPSIDRKSVAQSLRTLSEQTASDDSD